MDAYAGWSRHSSFPFGQTSTSPFGAQPGFGHTNNAATNNPFAPKSFGSPSPFGSQFGSSMLGASSSPAFGPTSAIGFEPNTNSSNIVPSPSPFGSNPWSSGGNNAFTTNSSNIVSVKPSLFESYPPTFGGNASNNLNGGSSVASYRATNETDFPTSMMQSISTMDVYANKSHEELRHEDYQMNNKGRPNSIFGSFGVTRTPNSVVSANFFAPQTHAFGFPTKTTPTPNNAFYGTPPANPFSPSISPFGSPIPGNHFFGFGPRKTSDPFSVPSANNLFTHQPQGFFFPPNTTTLAPNNPFFIAPSKKFPVSVSTPVVFNWDAFAPSAQPLPENNVDATSATPIVSGTPHKCCYIPAKPEVVSTTNPSQPSQASSSSTAVKEVGSHDKNGQQNTLASATQPETIASVQYECPSVPVETVLSGGMSSLSIGRSPTDTYNKGETTENKARASFRVNVDCIDIDDVSSIMPKLPPGKEYYTEPSIEELEAKERAEPGYCGRVKDFVVGRKDKGSIKFLGETDVRELDLESIVQFNNREVVVYLDETKMPPAEVTLLNVKCISKLTGKQYIDGPQLRKYEEKLIEKAAEIGGESILFDPVKGLWNFNVFHF